jgi:glycosyltransferase involved in cell wall biosynthesis
MLVDDGSTDDTRKIALKLPATIPASGFYITRKTGAKALLSVPSAGVPGEYIIFVDADDSFLLSVWNSG